MSIKNRAIAFLFVVFFVAGVAMPISHNIEPTTTINLPVTPIMTSSTNYLVSVTVLNMYQAFNDDDFEFYVRNGTIPLANALVQLFNASDMSFAGEQHTDGNGKALFMNLPVGTYTWNVTDATDPISFKTGQIVSNGPEAYVSILFGNLDWQNNQDDLNATITDVEGNPANNLNFTILYSSNNSIWEQKVVVDGRADFENLPDATYNWRLTVLYDIEYAGYLLASGTVVANGTQMLVNSDIGQMTGVHDLYDLEVFTYYETSLSPISGALVNVTFKNGTEWSSQYTPANGTVLFVDLPVAYMNWTVTLGGIPLGDGNYSCDFTAPDRDVTPPVITSPGDQEFLYDAQNITITWHIEDIYPKNISVYVDNVLNSSIAWVNSTYDYTFNVSSAFNVLLIGSYKIKLVATDQNENSATDIINLRLYENVTPIIEGPGDGEFYFTQTGYELSWNMSDAFINDYSLMDNGVVVASAAIDPDNPVLTYSLNGLAIGIHNFTLYVNDTSGNTAFDEVTVTVLADTTPPVIVFAPSDIYYNQGDSALVRNWTATDMFKDYYTIDVDGNIIVNQSWTSDNIQFDFSGLSVGQHTVTLTVYDIGGNSVVSVVHVYVSEPVMARYYTWISVIAVGTIVVVAIVWFVRYR